MDGGIERRRKIMGLAKPNKMIGGEFVIVKMEEKKENEEEFSYDSLWENEDARKEKRLIKELPRGIPRRGIKEKWIKRKNHITRNQIRGSYGSFIRKERKKIQSV